MTLDPTPPGIHPTDAMLLLLGDVRSDDDAAELAAELLLLGDVRSDDDAAELAAELRLGAASGALTADGPFTPALVADAWSHLRACGQCSSRRRALFVELALAISSAASHATADVASTLDSRVRAAVAELVPTAAAVPESLARPAPPRRRWFARRGGVGIGTTSGHGGAVARPWIVGIAAAALLLAVGAAFALRPRMTEQSAVGTVPPRVERAAPSDTTSLETSVLSETEAAAETEAALAAGAMADEPAASTAAMGGAPPATTANPSVDQVAPIPAAPEAATGRATSLPVEPSPARASSKTTAESAGAANPVPPLAAKKKASAPANAASAAVAPGPQAGSEPLSAAADLGTFPDAASALDRFAARAAAPTDAATSELGQQPGAGSGNASNTASPAAAPLSAAAPTAEPVLCPTVKGSPRLPARIGDRVVLVVRTADATADLVLDAASCVELARRTNPPTSAPVGG